MSWDVFIHRSKESGEAPLGTAGAVRTAVAGTLPAIRWSDDRWGVWNDSELTMEFNLGSRDPVDSLMIHVRGSGDPIPPIVQLCTAQGWAATDSSSGDEIDFANPSRDGWNEFVSFRAALGGAVVERTGIELLHLSLGSDSLRRTAGTRILAEHRLGEIADLRFERRVSGHSVLMTAALFAAAVAAAAFLDNRWLGITVAAIFSALGLFVSLGIVGDCAKFTAGGKQHLYWLVGPPGEVATFRTSLRDAVERAHGTL